MKFWIFPLERESLAHNATKTALTMVHVTAARLRRGRDNITLSFPIDRENKVATLQQLSLSPINRLLTMKTFLTLLAAITYLSAYTLVGVYAKCAICPSSTGGGFNLVNKCTNIKGVTACE
ncbi:hypothetical protein PAXINDRAFT_18335 [Paxillus involutus ATCC 200175]|uniref:Uncharacterized protein n=1 Tax=Paxillus involutus ATCC 200175 TaxID=664439 RepID=A0A0C9SNY6_PAXIN|nr:hypothetical protein PAXINDRAFT_18335 [Paxillus involutus ATCC 200175]